MIGLGFKHFRTRPGLTLVELLVVAAVFSVTMLVGTAVFTSVQSRQSDLLRRQRVVADGRYLLETMARTIRTEAIDYRYYYDGTHSDANPSTGPALPAKTIVTRNDVNEQTCFQLSADQVHISSNCQTSPNWRSITPPDLRVVNFWAYIRPSSNPYAPPPKSSTDCRVNAIFDGVTVYNGYDQANGTCRCRSSGTNFQDDCFLGQQCASALANQTLDNNGQGLCTNHAGGQTCYCRNANIQPQITIFMETESRGSGLGLNPTITLQTTVVSRAYGR